MTYNEIWPAGNTRGANESKQQPVNQFNLRRSAGLACRVTKVCAESPSLSKCAWRNENMCAGMIKTSEGMYLVCADTLKMCAATKKVCATTMQVCGAVSIVRGRFQNVCVRSKYIVKHFPGINSLENCICALHK